MENFDLKEINSGIYYKRKNFHSKYFKNFQNFVENISPVKFDSYFSIPKKLRYFRRFSYNHNSCCGTPSRNHIHTGNSFKQIGCPLYLIALNNSLAKRKSTLMEIKHSFKYKYT